MKKREWKPTDEPDEPSVPFGKCHAFGCPLDGSMSHATNGSSSWVCQAHFHHPVSTWKTITERLNNRRNLVNLTREIRMAMNGKPVDIHGWMVNLKNRGLIEWMPTAQDRRIGGNISMRKWLSRLEKLLIAEATSGLEPAHENIIKPLSQDLLMQVVEEFMKAHNMAMAHDLGGEGV